MYEYHIPKLECVINLFNANHTLFNYSHGGQDCKVVVKVKQPVRVAKGEISI